MLVALWLSLLPILGGTLLTYLYDRKATFAARLAAGASTGLALFASLGFLLALLLGLQPLTIVLTELALVSPLALLINSAWRQQVHQEIAGTLCSITFSGVALYLLLALLLWLVFDRALFEKPDGLYTGLTNNLGDLPFHLQVIGGFLHGRNFPPEDPTYSGQRFVYPFLADFLTSMFVRGGASLRAAMLVQDILLALSLAGVL